ncbi:MAG TPA: tannase/feruloyl esterase family alpha/beta hydrolase [Caulobacteraceae bacterium]|nr:tannase/feruloyl esterase family alpha/beta hydrolase [Caulobacteraceae bacterium]
MALALGLPAAAHAAGGAPAIACADLAKAAMPGATVTAVQAYAAGEYKLPSNRPEPPGMSLTGRYQHRESPAFCRVSLTLAPSADSAIRMEVWLPTSGWNGKFLGVANFGWGGSLMYDGMFNGVLEGYAAASNDTGHDGSGPDGQGGRFSLGHPEKVIDYAYRADHDMTVDAKAIIKAFYGSGPVRSYFIGCSLGGLEGLIEAKRYPADYDGIVAGAPPNPLTTFNAAQLWPSYLVSQDPSRMMPEAKYALVHDAVLKACASPIGQAQGLVEQPDLCRFDPVALQCKGADAPDCLTAPQVFLMRSFYRGPVDPRTNTVIFPGPARGSELGLYDFANGKPFTNALDLYRYTVFQDADWESAKMDWDKDVKTAIAKVGPLLDVDSDLKPFLARGGKLLMYIGWNDYHNPEQLIDYYKALIKTAGPASRGSVRLFTIPGMNHCLGGAGCDTFSKLGVIDAWVDQGQVPERIVAAKIEKFRVVRTRPLCAYPMVARYMGKGDANDAASFDCVAAAKAVEARG